MAENSELTCNRFSNSWAQVKDKLSRHPLISYSESDARNSHVEFQKRLSNLPCNLAFCCFVFFVFPLSYGEGQQKRATCLATLLQNEWKTGNKKDRFLSVGGRTLNIGL